MKARQTNDPPLVVEITLESAADKRVWRGVCSLPPSRLAAAIRDVATVDEVDKAMQPLYDVLREAG